MKLRVLATERFSCHSCGNCCRGWRVELLPADIEKIREMFWPADDALHGVDVLDHFAGKTVLAHRAGGACVFLDEATNRCRIHEKFGESAKPLGCRLFPFHITPTFRNEASVTTRFDCPSVRKNRGVSLEERRGELERYARELNLPQEGFDEKTRSYLHREQIEAIVDFAGMLLGAFKRDDQRAIFLFLLAGWLPSLKVNELDRAMLGNAFPMLKEQVEILSSGAARRPGAGGRLAFRALLALALRRDEDIMKGHSSRLGRAVGMTKVILGRGGLRDLGASHREGKLAKARLFHEEIKLADSAAMSLHWRMIRAKLGSMQFMGPANGGRDFLAGLRSLAMLYPLVVAVARYSAGNRGSHEVNEDDVEYAVMAIEHSYGKLPILNQPQAKFLEARLMEPETFVRLVRSV